MIRNIYDKIKKYMSNNKGMSLVEAIVGVGILSVAVIPILTILANTTRYSAVAKVKQRATNAGMSVMESFKAYGVEESQKRFENATFMPDAAYVSFPGQGAGDDYSGPYTGVYELNNVKLSGSEASGAKTYNVLVTVSEDQKIDYNTGNSVLDDETKEKYKETPYYNPNTDVTFTEDSAEYNPSFYIKKNIDDNDLYDQYRDTISDIEVTRTIHFDINSVGEVDIWYEFKTHFIYNGAPVDITDTKTLDDVLKSTEELESIFFYYYPAYNDRNLYNIKIIDKFYFDNRFDKSIALYVFKQVDGSKSRIAIKNAEYDYKVTLGADSNSKELKVYDIIDQNLGDLGTYNVQMFDTYGLSEPDDTDGSRYILNSNKVIVFDCGLSKIIKNAIISYKITVEVIDPNPIFSSESHLAKFSGTVMK